ncbi:MAG: hypothetical protein A2151_03635 [Candidatus Muproteobacteria bacterium RBG_16_65_34]|uniref:histidine kinase n=1 Tax=Candidatus Muproteobacteria bacterium RBG_16_65_34 TaxID=1817760 RepID=A0A1F6TQ70_9PROT|nr:MAG: hypothetical protein A2151_03635 [Candidatus Muproteobacteria bacterium RBG_16_65_34]
MDEGITSILLVEDNAADVRLIEELLTEAGARFEITHAERLSTAQVLLAERRFDAVLLDLGLPDSHGLESLTAMVEAARDMPIVVLTGLNDEATAVQALRHGVEDYLVKGNVDGDRLTRAFRYAIERKRAETALRRSEERFSKVFHASPLGIVISSLPEGRIVDANEAFLAMYGFAREEMIGRAARDLNIWVDLEDRARLMQEMAETGRSRNFEARFRRKSGEIGTALSSAEKIELGGEACMLSLLADVTERKRAEEALKTKDEELRAMTQQLWQTAKLATMGEIAASVAHEINNPLGIVSLRVEALLAETPPADERHRSLEIIEQEVERMGGLVANLLHFSRRGTAHISTVDLRDELGKTLELMHYHLRNSRVTVAPELAPDLPMIQADRQQLRQLFLNLIANACDAMPGGGELGLRARAADGQVLIEIADTGAGIPPEDLARVMDPFYTTKPEGKGTGLGLAISRRIVQEHRGTIELSSEGVPGKGTTVRVALPVRNSANGNYLKGDRDRVWS